MNEHTADYDAPCFLCVKPATHVVYGYPCCLTHGNNLYRNWMVTAA